MDIGHHTVHSTVWCLNCGQQTWSLMKYSAQAQAVHMGRTRQPQHQLDHMSKGCEQSLLCTDTTCPASHVMLCHAHRLAGDIMPGTHLASSLASDCDAHKQKLPRHLASTNTTTVSQNNWAFASNLYAPAQYHTIPVLEQFALHEKALLPQLQPVTTVPGPTPCRQMERCSLRPTQRCSAWVQTAQPAP
jgi:hypothetical protein